MRVYYSMYLFCVSNGSLSALNYTYDTYRNCSGYSRRTLAVSQCLVTALAFCRWQRETMTCFFFCFFLIITRFTTSRKSRARCSVGTIINDHQHCHETRARRLCRSPRIRLALRVQSRDTLAVRAVAGRDTVAVYKLWGYNLLGYEQRGQMDTAVFRIQS